MTENMRQTTLLILILLSIFTSACGQRIKKPDQEKISRAFLALVFAQDYDGAWKYFSKDAQKRIDISTLKTAGQQLAEEVKFHGDSIHLTMTKKIFEGGHTYTAYSFKFDRDVTKGPLGLLIDVVFENEEATKIVGFNYKKPQLPPLKPGESISTSTAKEDRIGELQTWLVDGKDVKIIEISLVHFAKDESMLVIKVEYAFTTLDAKSAKLAGLPFAREAFNRKWRDMADEKTKALGKTLLPMIGIALCKPGLREGYRTTFLPEEYEQ